VQKRKKEKKGAIRVFVCDEWKVKVDEGLNLSIYLLMFLALSDLFICRCRTKFEQWVKPYLYTLFSVRYATVWSALSNLPLCDMHCLSKAVLRYECSFYQSHYILFKNISACKGMMYTCYHIHMPTFLFAAFVCSHSLLSTFFVCVHCQLLYCAFVTGSIYTSAIVFQFVDGSY